MKQHNLFIMCGAPGSGKSTWLSKQENGNPYIISRDDIRFEMVKESQPYFALEKEVFKRYVNSIQEAIDSEDTPENIYCDATHITSGSRNKLLNALKLTNVKNVTVVVVRPSLQETLNRNDERHGRKRVPRSIVRRMWLQFDPPEEDENRIYDTIYVEVPNNEEYLADK